MMRKSILTFVLLSIFGTLHAVAQESNSQQNTKTDEPDVEKTWKLLERPEPDATLALAKLMANQESTLEFLKKELKPASLSQEKFESLMKQLGSEKKEVWQAAHEQLQYFDPRLHLGLTDLMEKFDENPTRSRLVEVLSGREMGSLEGKKIALRNHQGSNGETNYNFSDEQGSWWAEAKIKRINIDWFFQKPKWSRASRAVVLLEFIGTNEAESLLKMMAMGHPEAQPTRAARAAAIRLKVKTWTRIPRTGIPRTGEPQEQQVDFDKVWEDLKDNEPKSTVATLQLIKHADAAVAFLKERVEPLILEDREFDKLIKELGSDDEKTWKAAHRRLQYLDPRLNTGLVELMEKFEENPTRSRLVEILSGHKMGALDGKAIKLRSFNDNGKTNYNFSNGGVSWWAEAKVANLTGGFMDKPDWRRLTRAIIILEQIGTKDAMKILLKVSTGHPEAKATGIAKKAAFRLKSKNR